MKNILVIRLSAMGDVLLTTPVLARLKAAYPEAVIHFLVKEQYYEFIAACPHADKIHTWNQNQSLWNVKKSLNIHFDLIVDLQSNLKTRALCLMLQGVEKRRYEKPYLDRLLLVWIGKNRYEKKLKVTERYMQTLSGLLPEMALQESVSLKRSKLPARVAAFTHQPFILIAPGARWATKRWPVEYFVSLASKILEKNPAMQIVWLGGQNEADVFAVLSTHPYLKRHKDRMLFLAGELAVTEITSLADAATVAVTNDSGLMHALSAATTPLIALFLSTVEEFGFFPLGKNAQVLAARNIECRPCSHTGRDACPKKHFRCGFELSADQVYAAVVPFLSPRTAQTD